MITGVGSRMKFNDETDEDGEIRVLGMQHTYDYIDKQHAIDIIRHLTEVFDIDEMDL